LDLGAALATDTLSAREITPIMEAALYMTTAFLFPRSNRAASRKFQPSAEVGKIACQVVDPSRRGYDEIRQA
jgi:hypothetical protein